nr:FtsL-like putative cell division protein [uncultured Flavobacterium sp.]
MKDSIYSVLKAKYLSDKDAQQKWIFILFLLFLGILMIANSHLYESKSLKITSLNEEVKDLRSQFVDKRSELMEMKMESSISKKMERKGIYPSEVAPVKIKVKNNQGNFIKELWQ